MYTKISGNMYDHERPEIKLIIVNFSVLTRFVVDATAYPILVHCTVKPVL